MLTRISLLGAIVLQVSLITPALAQEPETPTVMGEA